MTPRAKSIESRNLILRTAIPFFATRGFHGTTLREIAKSAGVALSALHYYFESKEALFAECFRSIYAPLSDRRLEALAEVEAGGHVATLEEILTAFVAPLVHLCIEPEGEFFIKLQSRILEDPTITARLQPDIIGPTAGNFLKRIRALLADGDEDQVMRTYRSFVWSVTLAPIDPMFETLSGKPAAPGTEAEAAALTRQMVRMFAAAFRAC